MEYNIKNDPFLWKEEYEEIEDNFIKVLHENKFSIADAQLIFNDIMMKLTRNMPISTDKIKD